MGYGCMSAEGYVSPAGLLVDLEVVSEGQVLNKDADQVSLRVNLPTGGSLRIEVQFPIPPIIDHNARAHFSRPFDKAFAKDLAILATLRALDSNPELTHGNHTIEFNADDLYALVSRPRLSDKECRRYIARKLYSAYTAGTLDIIVQFYDMDRLITGNSEVDFIRNVQLLEAEEYAIAHLAMGPTLSGVQPTAKLVREVERWGGPKDDVSSSVEYEAQITAYRVLTPCAQPLLTEHARFLAARSPAELESVFRAIAPIVEAVARDMLCSHGCIKDLSTLGPIIGEIQTRGLGGIGLISQLKHVLKFGRDLAEHGHAVSEPVLRIACENAFDLAPQLASLYAAAV
jgi:hypothetical protein